MLKKIGAVAVSVAPLSAFAAVPAQVTTALADMATDTMIVAGAFLALAITLAAYKFMRRGAN